MKKFALNNSYFKNIRYGGNLPTTPLECLNYKETNGERPFRDENNNISFYDVYIEYQKRNKSQMKYADQFFTPPKTAERLGEITKSYYQGGTILDACCGFGMLSDCLDFAERIEAFDWDRDLCECYTKLHPEKLVKHSSFEEYETKQSLIISNPPYAKLPEFLEWVYKSLNEGGVGILIVPMGYMKKQRPKKLVQILDKFSLLEIEPTSEEFAHTKIKTEIVVIKK